MKINPQAIANQAIDRALKQGTTPDVLFNMGVKLLMKDLKTEGILPKGTPKATLDQVKMALGLAIQQLAANTQPAEVTGGVTA